MNVQIQNNYNYFSKYSPKTSNINLINYNNVLTFGGKRDKDSFEKKNAQQTESKAKGKMAEWAEKLALSFYDWSEKLSGNKKDETENQGFNQAKEVRDLTRSLNKANEKIEKLTKKTNDKDEKINELNDKISELNKQIAGYQKENIDLKIESKKYQNELQKVIDAQEKEEINPVKREQIFNEIKNAELNYDPQNPYYIDYDAMYNPNQYKNVYENIKTGTTNRADMQDIIIPEIKKDGSFDFTLPKGEMKAKKSILKELNEPFEIQSNISEKYSDSLSWDNDKVSRDLLQNFFDGHGQTLDGVHFKFMPNNNSKKGKYKVRIEGDATYNYKEAILLGESSSHNNKNAAGNYGEGLKMITLKLLTQNKASDVKIGSGNWQITCSLKDDERLDSKLINYKVDPVENYDGNYIEFETSDMKFLQTLRKSINRFYHSSNSHFKCPDFENDLFGIKVLPKNETGGLYIAGQRFEVDGDYDLYQNAVIFIKEKVPADKLDVSRDRISISHYNFNNIANWLSEKTTTEDQKKVLKCTEDFVNTDYIIGNLNGSFAYDLGYKIKEIGAIKFPDNFLSGSAFVDDKQIENLQQRGYKIFPRYYEKLGMKSIYAILDESKQHIPLSPERDELIKINILKKALENLSSLEGKEFNQDELDTKIYLFDAKSKAENSLQEYSNVEAEAIIEDNKCKGFWIDKNYLKNSSFPQVLETTLHELSHKAGGDGTREFGYKLTEVNEKALIQIINDPKIAQDFRIYSDIWNSI